MKLKILTFDELSHAPCKEAIPGDVAFLISDMLDTLASTKRGVGLAAPQVGVDVRVIVVSPHRLVPVVMLNPEITRHGSDVEVKAEGCLSYPGLSEDVERYRVIDVGYCEPGGGFRSKTYKGMQARIIQHEIDHLDGKCKVAP